MPKGQYERKPNRYARLLELFVKENRHTFLKPGQGQLGRMSKDFYLIPAERVEEIVNGKEEGHS